MSPEIILRLIVGRPFVPFLLYTSDGRVLRITHPEMVTVERDVIAVTVSDPAGHLEYIDRDSIVSFRTLIPVAE
jgi:hypothetical protein